MALTANITGYAKDGTIGIKSQVINLDKTIAAAADFGRRAARELGGALFREGEGIMAESKIEVPVDTGVLRSTGHVKLPRRDGDGMVVELGYGGPATPYALRQHEDITLRHTVGKARYLADPFERHVPDMDERMAVALRARLAEVR